MYLNLWLIALIAGALTALLAGYFSRRSRQSMGLLESMLASERRLSDEISHEMRTPLAATRANIQIALGEEDPQLRQQALERAMGDIDRATRTVDQLLKLARLKPEWISAETDSVDATQAARALIAEVAPDALHRGVEISLTHVGHPRVFCRPEAMELVLRNLVENAVRAAEPQGQVEVSVQEVNHHCQFRICDNGPGIPPESRNNMLEPFARGRQHSSNGAGLGLAIVTRVVQQYGGHLELGDGPGGRGLMVTVTCPSHAE